MLTKNEKKLLLEKITAMADEIVVREQRIGSGFDTKEVSSGPVAARATELYRYIKEDL
jgi:hypothetical protein